MEKALHNQQIPFSQHWCSNYLLLKFFQKVLINFFPNIVFNIKKKKS